MTAASLDCGIVGFPQVWQLCRERLPIRIVIPRLQSLAPTHHDTCRSSRSTGAQQWDQNTVLPLSHRGIQPVLEYRPGRSRCTALDSRLSFPKPLSDRVNDSGQLLDVPIAESRADVILSRRL